MGPPNSCNHGQTLHPMLRSFIRNMSSKPTMNVQSFPRPPKLEKISRHVRVAWEGQDIAETNEAFWVLEMHHPPTYYLPPSSMRIPLTKLNAKHTASGKEWPVTILSRPRPLAPRSPTESGRMTTPRTGLRAL